MKLRDTGLTAQDIKDKVNRYVIETYERFDFLAETAKDQYVYDENGEAYLDFYAGIAVNSAGNCNDKVVAAVRDQVGDIMHTFNYPYTIPQALLAEINELLDRDLAANAKKVGAYFMEQLRTLPRVKDVRCQGLLVGVEFDDSISGVDVKHGCLDRRLLITAIGAHTIRMIPPLIITEADCDKAVAIVRDTVEALS